MPQSRWLWKRLGPRGALIDKITIPLLPSPPFSCFLTSAQLRHSTRFLLIPPSPLFWALLEAVGGGGRRGAICEKNDQRREREREEGERRDNATPGNGRHGNSRGNPGQNPSLIKKLINCLWIAYLCVVAPKYSCLLIRVLYLPLLSFIFPFLLFDARL